MKQIYDVYEDENMLLPLKMKDHIRASEAIHKLRTGVELTPLQWAWLNKYVKLRNKGF